MISFTQHAQNSLMMKYKYVPKFNSKITFYKKGWKGGKWFYKGEDFYSFYFLGKPSTQIPPKMNKVLICTLVCSSLVSSNTISSVLEILCSASSCLLSTAFTFWRRVYWHGELVKFCIKAGVELGKNSLTYLIYQVLVILAYCHFVRSAKFSSFQVFLPKSHAMQCFLGWCYFSCVKLWSVEYCI